MKFAPAIIAGFALAYAGCDKITFPILESQTPKTEQPKAAQISPYAQTASRLGYSNLTELREMPAKLRGPMIQVATEEKGDFQTLPRHLQTRMGEVLPKGIELFGKPVEFAAVFAGTKGGTQATVAFPKEGGLFIFLPIPPAAGTDGRFILQMSAGKDSESTAVVVR